MKGNIARYLTQRFLFMLSFQMRAVAVGWQVYGLTHDPLALGYVGLAQFVPTFLLSVFAGQVADRSNRKTITALVQIADCLGSLLFLLATLFSNHSLGYLYAILVLQGAARPFGGAASQSLLPSLVDRETFPKAAALSSSVWQLATVTGPMIGGVLYAVQNSPIPVYILAALLGAGAAMTTSLIDYRQETHSKETLHWRNAFDGVKYIWRNQIILGSISLDLFAGLLGGAVALLPIYADILHVGPTGLGAMRAAPGLGAMLFALILTRNPIREKIGAKLFTAIFLFGVVTILFGISKNFLLTLLCLFLLGALDMTSVVVRGMLVQLLTPHEMRGRVSAVNLIFIGASNELGEFESGITARWWGTVPSVVIGGLATSAIVVAGILLFPKLRRLDRLSN